MGCGGEEGDIQVNRPTVLLLELAIVPGRGGGQDSAGIFKQSVRARNREEIGLSYRPARLHRLAELIPWNRFLGSINV